MVPVYEWAVQNQEQQLAPGHYTLTTPTFDTLPPLNASGEMWMRISVAAEFAPQGVGQLPDGRGPQFGYSFGETEDFRLQREYEGRDNFVPVQ